MSIDSRRLQKLHKRYPLRRAAITGAAAGLGKALALELAAHGWTMWLNDQDKDRLAEIAVACEALGVRVSQAHFDVADLDAFTKAANTFIGEAGGVDLVFACAGIGVGGAFLDTHPKHLREVVNINLMGVMWTAKCFLPSMVDNRRGHLVTIASAAAFHGLPHLAGYAATKAGVVQFSETLRSEMKPYGVDITTKMTTFYTSTIAEHTRGSDTEREKARSLVEMAPWSAEDVAEALLLGVQKRKFYMVAPGQARFLWLFKRLFPELYLRLMPAVFPKLEAKLLAIAAAQRKA